MNYLSYFVFFNLILLLIYSLIAYRFQSFSRVRFRISGFIMVKFILRFCAINLFLYLVIQFYVQSNDLEFRPNQSTFKAAWVYSDSNKNQFDESNFINFSNSVSNQFGTYTLYAYDKEHHKAGLLIPPTSYNSFINYIKNKDFKHLTLFRTNFESEVNSLRGKKEGLYVNYSKDSWIEHRGGVGLSQQEYLGFSSNLDLYLLILLALLLLSEALLSFQIIKY